MEFLEKFGLSLNYGKMFVILCYWKEHSEILTTKFNIETILPVFY